MSFNPETIKLMQTFRVAPLNSIANLSKALTGRTKANPQDEETIISAGYRWDDQQNYYISDRGYQTIVAFPNGMFLWIMGSIGRVLKNSDKLKIWVEGRSNEFSTQLLHATGEDQPVQTGGVQATNRPEPPSQISKVDQILKTVQAGSRMKADKIIDLYKVAKETGSEPLMKLVKTLQLQAENIKKSDLKRVIKEIVKGVFKEMSATVSASPVSTPLGFKKKEEEEEQIEEITSTDAVSGYNVPSAFSRKGGSKSGIKGSEKLGYTLTGIGKKEMQRHGDNL